MRLDLCLVVGDYNYEYVIVFFAINIVIDFHLK